MFSNETENQKTFLLVLFLYSSKKNILVLGILVLQPNYFK